ncbi:MAG: hypothetical protein AAB373_01140 [Patescibacteria group bacterium]
MANPSEIVIDSEVEAQHNIKTAIEGAISGGRFQVAREIQEILDQPGIEEITALNKIRTIVETVIRNNGERNPLVDESAEPQE